jgi:hypothetical protein
MPAKKMKSIARNRRSAYESMRSNGMSKSKAAAIANAGKTRQGRRAMARKAAKTRRTR